jgi:hypothetical protein
VVCSVGSGSKLGSLHPSQLWRVLQPRSLLAHPHLVLILKTMMMMTTEVGRTPTTIGVMTTTTRTRMTRHLKALEEARIDPKIVDPLDIFNK